MLLDDAYKLPAEGGERYKYTHTSTHIIINLLIYFVFQNSWSGGEAGGETCDWKGGPRAQRPLRVHAGRCFALRPG